MVKYVYWDSKNKIFHIRRRIKGKLTNFGTYKTLKECKLAVKLYDETGWHPEDNWKIKAQVKETILNQLSEVTSNGSS